MRKEWMEKDYYAEIGVAKDADHKTIKKAFRKLAREFHPDNNPGDDAAETRFKEINEAYDTIGDEDQRKEYDHAREMGYFVGGPQGNQQYVRVEDLLGVWRRSDTGSVRWTPGPLRQRTPACSASEGTECVRLDHAELP